MQNLTKADQDLKQYEECLEYSEQVSEGLKKGAEYVGRGMVKGAIKSSEWMYLGLYFFFHIFIYGNMGCQVLKGGIHNYTDFGQKFTYSRKLMYFVNRQKLGITLENQVQ